VKKIYKFLLLFAVTLVCAQVLLAQVQPYAASKVQGAVKTDKEKSAANKNDDDDNNDKGDDDSGPTVSTLLINQDKYAIYDAAAKYTFVIKNPTNNVQVGTVSYQVSSEKGQKLNNKVVKVNIGKKSTGKYDFDIPEPQPGFYKVSFMVNVSDYDDTTLVVFGIRPQEIQSPFGKPADFDDFWRNNKAELDKIDPRFKVTLLPDSTKDNRNVYLVEMKSLGNLTIRGYLTVPIASNKHKKFAVLLGLPGYQVGLHAMFGSDPDLAIMTLNVRGQGNSRDVISTRRNDYIFYHIENRNKYVMRGAIMDCVRAVDFICSRPELDHNKIMVSGGSMGGFLSIATSSIDKRVTLCSAQNPIMSDVHNLDKEVNWPLDDIRKYIKIRPGLTYDKVISNLEYYDSKNFATNLTCPTLIGIGLLDPLVPPNNAYAVYNSIRVKKHIIIFRDLGHEVGIPYKSYEGRWMRDTFGLF
jgi:cephalosporin-C deacetylase